MPPGCSTSNGKRSAAPLSGRSDPAEGSSEDWGKPDQPFLLHIDPDLEGGTVRPELLLRYSHRESS
jgi:hypothetical protein